MDKRKFLSKNDGEKTNLVFPGPGRPRKPESDKFTEKVTITLTKTQLKNMEENIGDERNKTSVLRKILDESGILGKK